MGETSGEDEADRPDNKHHVRRPPMAAIERDDGNEQRVPELIALRPPIRMRPRASLFHRCLEPGVC